MATITHTTQHSKNTTTTMELLLYVYDYYNRLLAELGQWK